jgi:hypothetical protein
MGVKSGDRDENAGTVGIDDPRLTLSKRPPPFVYPFAHTA